MRIAIASDHAAYELKATLADWLREQGHEVEDLGTNGPESVDYPDYGYRLGAAIAEGRADRGVALCGSGIGISISVNRNPAARCALVSEPLSAKLAREHNDANVVAMGARLTGIDMAKAALRVPAGDPRYDLVVDAKSWHHKASTALDFKRIDLNIQGVVVNGTGRSGMLLNGEVFEEGDYIADDLLVKRVEEEQVWFVFRGLTLVRTM